MSRPSTPRPTWLASDGLLARNLGRPVGRFLEIEASGGVLLVAATLAALVWSNSPWNDSYESVWSTVLTVDLGGHEVSEDLRHWVNDGLMTVFFFVVGLEIKRELVDGQLASVRSAAVPALAALGGMLVPAAVYLAVNVGGEGAHGWGIPMATDIAFAVGVLALLGDRIPAGLKVLLLGVAIVDDIGAIVVIAVFYSDGLSVPWGAAALVALAVVAVLRRMKVWFLPVYVVLGAAIWLATLESGVHATIAGVALALLTPAHPLLDEVDADAVAARLSSDSQVTAAEVREVSFEVRESVSVAERLQEALHPWTGYVIVPLFALANAGVELTSDALSGVLTSPVAIGILAGLVLGKLVGITGALTAGRRLGLPLPDEVGTGHVAGMAAVAGIGFTVSIFITGLAFADDPDLAAEAKIAILFASLVAALLGALVLSASGRSRQRSR